MSQNHLADNKAIYMKEKSGIALEECFQRCSRGKQDYKTVTNRELTCIEYCSIKFTNAYAYAFDLIHNGGISRASETELRFKTLKI